MLQTRKRKSSQNINVETVFLLSGFSSNTSLLFKHHMEDENNHINITNKGVEEYLCCVFPPVNPVSWNFFAGKQECIHTLSKEYPTAVNST